MNQSSSKRRILFLAANPQTTSPLRLDKEADEIERSLQRGQDRDRFELKTKWAVTVASLQQVILHDQPWILHFSGHGAGLEGLALETEQGDIHLVSNAALAGLCELAQNLECVVLNACYSEVQAEILANHISYVIGMNDQIGDEAARLFATGFYEALGSGRTILDAFKFGRNAIALMGIPEDLKPVLIQRSALKQLQACVSDPAKIESPEGQVGIESCFYIASCFEERCYEEIKKSGSLIRIKSPHNMGKSSLMLRVLNQAEKLGYRTVVLNLEQTNQKFFNDLDKFMQWFCASVGKPLGVRVKVEDYWEDIFGANDNSTEYFEKNLLNENEQPLVIAIDNFDRVFNYPDIETDFCGLLRGWHERARSKKIWGQLRLIIVYSQEPYLQKDINQSPFNVGLPIELGEFTLEQIQELIGLHGFNWSALEVERFTGLIGGHPYLVRSALYHIAIGDVTLESFLRTAPTEAGIYSSYLLGHLKSLEDHPALAEAMKKVVNSDSPVRLRSEEAFKLDSRGLVVRVENDVQPRCLLYRIYFRDRLGT